MTRHDTAVRTATAADIASLVDFQVQMARESEDKGLDVALLTNGVSYLIDHPAEGHYLVATCGTEVAGALMVTFEWSEWRNGRFWWIQSVYVTPEYRRRGVYSALHDALRIEARADHQACGIRLYVEQDNTGAMQTYRQLGMHETHYRLYEEEF